MDAPISYVLVFQSSILFDSLPFSGGVVHLEMCLNDHGQVCTVILQNTFLVLRQFDCHDIAWWWRKKKQVSSKYLSCWPWTKMHLPR